MNAPTHPGTVGTPPLWPELLAHAPDMHFFRFCELLERSAPDRPLMGATDTLADEPVRFRSRPQLGFPGREIDAVETDADNPSFPPGIRTTFLGLYGVDARMPSYFIDDIAQRREGAEPLAAFLDLFHHRIVTQYFRIWRKYRYPVGFEHDGRDPVSTYLLSLAGLGLGVSEIGQTVGPRKLLSMLGLVNQKTRTAEGLAGVLQHAVPDATITVEEFHSVWVTVDSTEPMPLGEQCVLGGGFFDRGHCVLVVIAPTSAASVLDLMPGRLMHDNLMQLLRFYLGYEAQAALVLQVPPHLMPKPVLDSCSVSLGYTSMLATSDPLPQSVDVRIRLGSWNLPSALNYQSDDGADRARHQALFS